MRDLPEVLQRLFEAGGLKLAQGFARAFGGRRVFVPSPERLTDDHPLAKGLAAQGLTLKDAQVLAGELGGYVDVPFGPFAGPARRRLVAQQLLAEGGTKAQIAQACEMTERTVYRIQAGTSAEDPDQLDFFK